MASKFGGVPVNEPLEKNEDLSSSKFGGVPVNQITPIVEQEDKAGFGTNLFRTIGGAASDVAQETLDVGADIEKAIPLGGF